MSSREAWTRYFTSKYYKCRHFSIGYDTRTFSDPLFGAFAHRALQNSISTFGYPEDDLT